MEKLEFLIGNWDMEYNIAKSIFSEATTDKGTAKFKRMLDDKYILFEYSTLSGSEAKGIFAWDDKLLAYRYWWFENSGNYLSATCNFISDSVLAMNWHESLLVQTYTIVNPDKLNLKMQYPSPKGGYDLILEVIFTKEED